ncbi:transcription factor UPBEAT1-like [Durio zibethinus]|uniref:Transcription factor UPBEAT1-like n=1 Tax=Durio zibethinus TaxID=66656 RepID=A0A6P5Y3U2_DURZI|nr:transcription factor UPBEAT1-like [Durio zibethinus]
MGMSPLPLLSFDSNGIHSNEEMSVSNGSPWSILLEAQAKRRMKVKKQRISSTRKKARHVRPRSILMKLRARQEGSRRPVNHIEEKVKTLKKLIPNSESMGLDGLLRETAEYILSLQMKVNVLQIMVRLLTGPNE